MSILIPYERARELLGVDPDAGASAIKAAYRARVAAHPPDRDPEGFRRLRDAYELLTDTGPRARQALMSPRPAVAPPALRAVEPTPRGAAAVALLRVIAARVDSARLLAEAEPKPVRRPSSESPGSDAPAMRRRRPARRTATAPAESASEAATARSAGGDER